MEMKLNQRRLWAASLIGLASVTGAKQGPVRKPADEGALAFLAAIHAPQQDTSSAPDACNGGMAWFPGDSNVTYSSNISTCVSFTINNTQSPRIDPQGAGVQRDYTFEAPGLARQEDYLYIHEQSAPDATAKDSQDSMETEIVFAPRLMLPALRGHTDTGTEEAILATGESVFFDATTHEVKSGVLAETAPIDTSANRFGRKFVGLQYTGQGIMIRSDQRGNSPRQAVVWGQKKSATVTYNGKTCTIPEGELYDQSSDSMAFLFPTDDALYTFLNGKCGWNLSAANFSSLSLPQ